jgi:hypothetical protein
MNTNLINPNDMSDSDLVKACSDADSSFSLPKSTRDKLIKNLFNRKPIIRPATSLQTSEIAIANSCENWDGKKMEERIMEILNNSYLPRQETTRFRGFFNWDLEFSSSTFLLYLISI